MWGNRWFSYLPIMFTSSFRLLVILDSFRTKDTYLKVSKKLQEWLDYVFEVQQCPRKPKVIHIHAQVDKPMSLVLCICWHLPWQVPLQKNSFDCGIYVLHFVKVFLSDPEFFTEFFQVWECATSYQTSFHPSTQQPGKRSDIHDIWRMDNFSTLRQDLLSYILSVELAAEK